MKRSPLQQLRISREWCWSRQPARWAGWLRFGLLCCLLWLAAQPASVALVLAATPLATATARPVTVATHIHPPAATLQPFLRAAPAPTRASISLPPSAVLPATTAACPEIVANGGFEENNSWYANPADNTYYDTEYYTSGRRSMSLDASDGRDVALWQTLTIPADASAITFGFSSIIFTSTVDKNVYVRVYNADFSTVLQDYYLIYDCDCEWFNFSPALDAALLAGQTVQLTFEVAAAGTIDDVNFDDVSLGVCRAAPTATPTTPPATATSTRPPATATTMPPTATPIAPTFTPLPPTATPLPPTATATALPTVTPTPPPTNTPPPAVADAYEPDDSCPTAKPLASDGTFQTHTFHIAAEQDWVQFTAVTGTTYRIEVQIPVDSPADVDLELYGGCDALPTAWSETFTPGVRFDFTAESNGPIHLKLKNNPDTRAGSEVAYQIAVRPLAAQQSGALIIVAGRLKLADPLQTNIHNVTDGVYALFQAHGYTDENILYLATDSERPGYDLSATKANLRNAITTWAAARVNPTRALTLYMMDHGGPNAFYLDEQPTGERVTPAELDGWLDTLEAQHPGLQINVIIEACNAGSFATGAARISAPGRVVITSTSADSLAYASATGAYFSDHLLTALRQGQSLLGSFGEAQAAVQQIVTLQQPWLDSDGDGVPNEVEDEAAAAARGFGSGSLDETTWPPFIAAATPPTTISDRRGTISAEVRDDKGVRRVWAVIYPPSYRAPTTQDQLAPETLPTIVLLPQGNNRYGAPYTGFDEAGDYQIVIHAEDGDGLEARPVDLIADAGTRLFLPAVMR